MRNRSYPVAGFIVPYKCFELKRQEKLDRNKMKIRKGHLRLSPNEEALLIKEETEKRRKLRLQQVREQSKENATKIRNAVKQAKHKQLMKLATDIKNQLEEEKVERVRHLEQQYDNSLRNIGVGHKLASEQPDWSEERALVQHEENLRTEARGRAALERQLQEMTTHDFEATKHIIARKKALEIERARASEVASMPPPPPDPLLNIDKPRPKPVKVVDMQTFATSHYHLQNEDTVDKAGPQEQADAREEAELEHLRIQDRAMELKRLQHDQLERARLRHNAALKKELLKHDFNNILHDLSDLQRADRDRRLKIVHNIPKQVFEPPNVRMEDREKRQHELEEKFEDMYMAGTAHRGDISLALDPHHRLMTATQESSIDASDGNDITGSPLLEPSLPPVPQVLRDMTNVPKPGKKPEKVLRNLMDRIKSQREDWMTSRSTMDVGEGPHRVASSDNLSVNDGQFHPLLPDESPSNQELPSPQKQPRMMSPVVTHESTNRQIPPEPVHMGTDPNKMQAERAEVLKQQEIILEKKRQLELKLQQLTFEQQRQQLGNQTTQPHLAIQPTFMQAQQPAGIPQQPLVYPPNSLPTNGFHQQPHFPAELFYSSAMPAHNTVMSTGMPYPPTQQAMFFPQTGVPFHPVLSNQHAQFPGHPPQPPSLLLPNQQMQFPEQTAQSSLFSNQHMQFPGQQVQSNMFSNQYMQFPGQPVQSTQLSSHNLQFPGQAASSLNQQFVSSVSSSGTSQVPMNSIAPTLFTGSAAIVTGQGHGYIGQPVQSTYQSMSAALTTDQWNAPKQANSCTNVQSSSYLGNSSMPSSRFANGSMPTCAQLPKTISPGHIPPTSLTNEGMMKQMQKVKEYQDHLLARHEQSKKVLEETKAEIKRRRENLLQKYPNLDLSMLEDMGAKYLETQHGSSLQIPKEQEPVSQKGTSVNQSVPVSSLLASLAAHPYYAATLCQPDRSKQKNLESSVSQHITEEAAQFIGLHPDINLNTNIRKHKLENIRKSLPFDGDDSFQTPVRMFEAYPERYLDTTSATDFTDTSSLTEKGSPELKPATKLRQQNTELRLPTKEQRVPRNTKVQVESCTDDSDMDETLSDHNVPASKEEELRKKFVEIQKQKEEIMKTYKMGQEKLQNKEQQLKAKLATVAASDSLSRQLRDQVRPRDTESGKQKELDSRTKTDFKLREEVHKEERTAASQVGAAQKDNFGLNPHNQFNLSTIPEIDTPVSTRPSDGGQSGISDTESSSQHSKRSQDFSRHAFSTSQTIFEQSGLEDIETQMQAVAKERNVTVAGYSSKNIDDVVERAKQFEKKVLEKLRKQTNAVLFDNQFDDSLEFNLSRRQISDEQLSCGSLTSESLSAGPLDDTTNTQDDKSTNGDFHVSKSWTTELSQYKTAPSKQANRPLTSSVSNSCIELTERKELDKSSMFSGNMNRFKVYSAINTTSSSDSSMSSDSSLVRSRHDKDTDFPDGDSTDARNMLQQLHHLQEQLRNGEEERQILVKKLAEKHNQTPPDSRSPNLTQYSMNSEDKVSRSLMVDHDSNSLSQYTLSDKSTDVSIVSNEKRGQGKMSGDFPNQSGTSSFHMTDGDDQRKPSVEGIRRTGVSSEMGSQSFGEKPNVKASQQLSSFSLAGGDGFSSNQNGFYEFSPDRELLSPTEITRSTGTRAAESLQSIKKEFEKLGKPAPKVKTYSVSRNGDLISENSDSDKSLGRSELRDSNITHFNSHTMSTKSESVHNTMQPDSFCTPSSCHLENQSTLFDKPSWLLSEKPSSNLSPHYIQSAHVSDSSVLKSTSLTSELMLNMTGASSLSQYTLNESKGDSLSASVTGNDGGNTDIQKKFASLDNLIRESKNLIAKNKKFIVSNKDNEMPHSKTSSFIANKAEREIKSDFKDAQPSYSSSTKFDERSVASSSRLPTFNLGNNSASLSSKLDTNVDENSLEYLAEHSQGITDEPLPDLASMNLGGSVLSMSEAFDKTGEFSESSDSLVSFEKHEMSEGDSRSTSHMLDDSLRDSSKSDTFRDIVEARKHNFMVQTERRAAAAKERALVHHAQREDGHPVFRAVPVNVVVEPTLSMAVNVTGGERGRPLSVINAKGSNSFSDTKKSFEVEKDNKTASAGKPLNRALQPRGAEGSNEKDSGTKPNESGQRPKHLAGSGIESPPTDNKSPRPRCLSVDNKSPRSSRGQLSGEILQFGGSAGFSQSPTTPRKTPPSVMPKPSRTAKPEPTLNAKQPSGLSKTLASWKKSRTIPTSSKLQEMDEPKEVPKNSIKVLPEDAPSPLTEEERRQRAEDEVYEKNIRAYNPRLFRLQHKLDHVAEEPKAQAVPEKYQDSKKGHDEGQPIRMSQFSSPNKRLML